MSEDADRPTNAAEKEQAMREEERKGREHADAEGGGDELGTPDSGGMPAPPGNVQGGGLGGAS